MANNEETPAEIAIVRAKLELRRKQCFWPDLMFYMRFTETKRVPTLSVDRYGHLMYNPEFILGLDEDQRIGALIHEIYHVAFLQCKRGDDWIKSHPSSNHLTVNLAMDALANMACWKAGYPLKGTAAVPDVMNDTVTFSINQFKNFYTVGDLSSKTMEEIISELDDFLRNNKQGQELKKMMDDAELESIMQDIHIFIKKGKKEEKTDRKGMKSKEDTKAKTVPGEEDEDESNTEDNSEDEDQGDESSNNGEDTEDEEDGEEAEDDFTPDVSDEVLEEEWKNRVILSFERSKQFGKEPAGMQRMIDKLLACKVLWQELLYNYIIRTLGDEYSWRRPSKKSLALGYYAPKRSGDTLNILVVLDTSSSITQKDLTNFSSDVVGLFLAFPEIKIGFGTFDTQFYLEKDEGMDLQELMLTTKQGGGGTDVLPVFKELEERGLHYEVIVIFTDGYVERFPRPEDAEGREVIWLISAAGLPEDHFPTNSVGLFVKQF